MSLGVRQHATFVVSAKVHDARQRIDVAKLESVADALLGEDKLFEDRIKAILDS